MYVATRFTFAIRSRTRFDLRLIPLGLSARWPTCLYSVRGRAPGNDEVTTFT